MRLAGTPASIGGGAAGLELIVDICRYTLTCLGGMLPKSCYGFRLNLALIFGDCVHCVMQIFMYAWSHFQSSAKFTSILSLGNFIVT